MELYNYECADNDIRKVRVFVPLRLIFGSCNVDRLLKVINLEIKIDRKPTADIGEIFYGGANTSVQFDGNDGTGVQNMTLQLMEYIPNPYLVNELNSYIGHGGKIHWTFRTRDCEKRASEQSAEVTLSTKRTTHPDYVYVVCKDVRQKNNVRENYSLCRHCNMDSIQVNADGKDFPDVEQKAEFNANNYNPFYEDFKTVCRCHGNEAALSATDYKKLYTIFAIDCSSHPVKGVNTTVDTRVTITRREGVAVADQTAMNPNSVDYFVIQNARRVIL